MTLTLTVAVRETDGTRRAFAARANDDGAVGLWLAGGGRGGCRFVEAIDGPKGGGRSIRPRRRGRHRVPARVRSAAIGRVT
jgi:hypothetical protein